MEVLSVVVWGATGVTGKRVCHELAVRYTVSLTLSNVMVHRMIHFWIREWSPGGWLDGIARDLAV